jgi:TolA-binding protein
MSGLALFLLLIGNPPALAQLKPDQAADMVLTSARRAYNEKNYSFAAGRFREFLARYGGHKDAVSAHYGLARCLLEGPDRDYQGAVEQLQAIAGNKDFAEHAKVLYDLGLAQRGLGMKELAQAAARPHEAGQRQAAARQRFEEAARQFAAAMAVFTAQAKKPPADANELVLDQEWLARTRCDLAEMLLRTGKAKEAQTAVEPFVKVPYLAKSRYHALGLYYHGFAGFLLNDMLAAGKSLNQLTPFADPVFGTHARYLLARVHHLSEERKEAQDDYEGVLADHAKQKQAAVEALRQPDKFKNDPEERARLEALTRDPPPDHVTRALFYLAVMYYEDGRFADALARFEEFTRALPKSSLAADALLRQGFCRVQLKQWPEALRTLQPLADHEPRLADQALFWIGKAQVGAADPNNPQAYQQALRTALDTIRRAAERAQSLVNAEPEARARRGDYLLELADTQQLVKQYREAAGTYNQVLNEKCLPQREEEVVQRLATAWHLAGEYAESEKICQRFQQAYPRSTLLPAVLFRYAENAYFVALAAEKNPNLPNRAQELARLHEEAAKRYQVVIDKFPEFPYTNLARYGQALAFYHKGDLEKARQTLDAIPQPDRTGDLAQVPYVLADCLMRLAPTRADDALTAGRMEEQLKAAVELLNSYLGAQPNAPQAADAMLKLGLCYQRLAGLLVQAPERAKSLGDARAAYETLLQRFPQHPLQPQAVFERAKCLAQAGDKQGATNELHRFLRDAPLKTCSVAPMALLQLSVLLREQKRAAEAVTVMAECRTQHEGVLSRDPHRTSWIPALQYQHGLALKEAGKLAEARSLFEQVVRQFPGQAEAAEAALRGSQCLQEEGLLKLEAASKARAAAHKPEELVAAQRTHDEGLRLIQEAVRALENQAEQLRQKQATADVRSRMIYDCAWGYRVLAQAELASAREQMQQELLKKKQAESAAKAPSAPASTATDSVPEVPLASIPLQPAEQKIRGQYQALIASFPDLPLATQARFELAELLAERNDHDAALKLLNDCLDKEPPAELTDKIHLRMGASYLAKKDAKTALAQFDVVAQNLKSPLAGEAHLRAGECLLQMDKPDEAVKHLSLFRDQPPFQNLPGISDRALLRLGHAFAALKQWDPSRQALENLLNRFGNSPWVHEARYGIGWAWQNQKQFDNAVNLYTQVTTATAAETAAKAQLQIGLCRLEQNRHNEAANALLVVPFTYDYPEWNAVALCEAARAFKALKQPEQAERLLRRVIRDHPQSNWAAVARDRLEMLSR